MLSVTIYSYDAFSPKLVEHMSVSKSRFFNKSEKPSCFV